MQVYCDEDEFRTQYEPFFETCDEFPLHGRPATSLFRVISSVRCTEDLRRVYSSRTSLPLRRVYSTEQPITASTTQQLRRVYSRSSRSRLRLRIGRTVPQSSAPYFEGVVYDFGTGGSSGIGIALDGRQTVPRHWSTTMGRPRGSKNRKNHNAGGARTGAGAKPKKKDNATAQRLRQQTLPGTLFGGAGDVQQSQEDPSESEVATAAAAQQAEEEAAEEAARLAEEARVAAEAEATRRSEEHRTAILQRLRDATADGSLDAALEQLPLGEDEEYFDPIQEEEDDDDNVDTVDSNSKKRKSSAYKPRKGSMLHTVLSNIRDHVKTNSQIRGSKIREHVLENGHHYVEDLLGKNWLHCDPTDPAPSYLRHIRFFVWLPLRQLKQRVKPISQCKCVHCGKQGYMESLEFDFRPFFDFDKLVWVVFLRDICSQKRGGCGRTCAQIDPRFLSSLPTTAAREFPFVSAGNRRIGMSEAMLHSFVEMIGRGLQFGAFASIFNSIYRLNHSREALSYYSNIRDLRNAGSASPALNELPEPFATFDSVGDYNGILISRGTVRQLFIRFSDLHHDYHQTSFHNESDEGAIADHTFQYAATVKQAAGREGKIFGASYTVASLLGSVVRNNPTFTKSNAELDPIVRDYRASRDKSGVGPLKIFTSDNIDGDGGVWEKHFSDQINQGVSPLVSLTDSSLPLATIPQDQVTYIESKTAATTWARAIFMHLDAKIRSGERILAGVDGEWNIGEKDGMRVLIVSLPGEESVAVFHLSAMGVHSAADFPKELKRFLELPNFVGCAVQVGGDSARLQSLGVHLHTRIELQQLALAHDPQQNGTSLEALSRRYLGWNVDKFGQHADYSSRLSEKLQKYCALDGRLHRLLAEKLLHLVQSKVTTGPFQDAPSHSATAEGTKVSVLIGGKCAAKATIVFVGGVNGAQRTFGEKFTVGKEKAIVRLTEVIEPTAKVPFSKANPSWTKNTTIGWIFANSEDEPDIVVRTSNLSVSVQANVSGDAGTKAAAPVAAEQAAAAAASGATAVATAPSNAMESDDGLSDEVLAKMMDTLVGDGVDQSSSQENVIRSRMHEDLWHQFNTLPFTKSCGLRAPIERLLIHGSMQFVEEDYRRMEEVLTTKKGIRKEDLLDHFYFNREKWRERVRMPTFPADQHGNNIQRIHNFVRTNSETKEYYTNDVKQYFENFEKRCREGRFAELHDISLYRQVGIDSDGLDLWIRLKGSVRCENIHQKMRVALGPHAIGVEVAHYLLIQICYRYNVNLGVRRKARPNFGHCFLYVMDELQLVVQELYNVLIYPAHCNFSLFAPPKDDIAVGIRPLTSFPEYVQAGEPMEHLTPDQKFMARMMKVECPPLPPSGPTEMSTLNKYYTAHPNMTSQELHILAKKFLREADGKETFPKLPCMLKADFGRWKKTALVKTAIQGMARGGYEVLLHSLATRKTAAGLLLQFEDTQVNAVPEDPLLQLDEEPLQAQQYVAPLCAPEQVEHVPIVALPATATSQQKRRCAWYPFCDQKVWQCHGTDRRSCHRANSGEFQKPSEEEFQKARKRLKAEERRETRKRKKTGGESVSM